MLKVLLKGPVHSVSGYGVMARTIYNALRSRPDLFDIYIVPTTWGHTSWTTDVDPYREEIDMLIGKTHHFNQNRLGYFDVAIQCTIPGEFEKIGIVNIGYTAGIETTKCSKDWLEKVNLMDKVIVISDFAKFAFENTIYDNVRLQTPLDVVHFPVNFESSVDVQGHTKLKHDFNFLAVSQWGPRKNIDNLVRWFFEEFQNDEVGLVVKTSKANNSVMDKHFTSVHFKQILREFPDAKCSLHLVHGNMSDAEMKGLYTNPRIKAFINLSHGEGFGLPIFEAAQAGMPVIATDWSGHLDFLTAGGKRLFAKVDYDLAPIQSQAVWENVLIADSMWAYPKPRHYKERLRSMVDNYVSWKKKADKLQKYILENFTKEKIDSDFVNSILGHQTGRMTPFEGVSFCIPTDGKKPEKTVTLINSIKRMNGYNSENVQIIIAGVTSEFGTSVVGVDRVEAKEEALQGQLAHLRNLAASVAEHDILCFVDDDFVFPETWFEQLNKFSMEHHWDVLGNRIHNPDGTRFWDRAVMNPHCLVSYEHPWYDKNLYQTGGFFVIRRDVYDDIQWDNNIKIYAEKEGKLNEDIDYCNRLHKAGYIFGFDKDNFVYHNDYEYTQFSNGMLEVTLRKSEIEKHLGPQNFLPESDEFLLMVGEIS